jgi:hypothetical protein
MNKQEERYIVKQRAENDVKEHGSVQKAIQYLKTKLEEMEALWGKYSSDCLGHGITCTRLKISWLERGLVGTSELKTMLVAAIFVPDYLVSQKQ